MTEPIHADEQRRPALSLNKGQPGVTGREIQDEESPLLGPSGTDQPLAKAVISVGAIVSVLLLGEFISNADATLVITATGHISSEFNRARDGNWLLTGYTLGLCAAQPMYGKLSDIYGRKPLLLLAYVLFGAGCLVCGIGSQMWVVILGRAISGTGSAGIMTVGSVIITDIVPRRDVATWRAYVNVVMTLGRSIGGPLGGWLTDTIGWRWLFLIQVPLAAIAALLVAAKLNLPQREETASTKSITSKLRQIDFLGMGLLGTAVIALTLLMDQGGKTFAWRSWQTAALGAGGLCLVLAFVLVELRIAAEPIFELRILRRPNVAASYLIALLQVTAQLAMMFSVPLYFQVTQRASVTASGAHLVPAVVGNAVGGLLAGMFIRRVGHPGVLLVLGGLVAAVSYVLLYLRWNGATGFLESLYIIPGGLGTGIASASSFVAMTVMLKPQEMAMATAGFMLVLSFAMTAGVTLSNTVLGNEFHRELVKRLHGPDSETIIRRAMEDTSYIAHLEGRLREVVVNSYIAGLKHTYVVSFVCAIAASFLGLFTRRHRI